MEDKVFPGSVYFGSTPSDTDNDLMISLDLMKADWQEHKKRLIDEQQRKSKEAVKRKVASGGIVFKAPRGYRNVRKGDKTWVEFDPSCAFQVEEAFKLAETGKYSVNRLCIEMTKKGLLGKDGKRLSQASMWKMLTNPFYCGYIRRHGELLPSHHPRLISKFMFDRIQEHLQRSSDS
jgi:hypothetical protein